MAHRVNLDAMIKREDFARENRGDVAPRTITELKLSDLLPSAAIRRQLRKPEFQRETNHWTPDQVVKLVTSFLDEDVIPSIILWRSVNYIFVIDGAHRLSALCAWIQDDYGDGTESKTFYSDEISQEQRRVAERVRKAINTAVGTYASLDRLVGEAAAGMAGVRAGAMNSQPIVVQTVKGTSKAAEDSFFAINKQGTALDETEEYLIRNRNKPVSIGARAIVRAGFGHSYWSSFNQSNQEEVIRLAGELHRLLFDPEASTPLRTLDLPLAGSKSPVDALAVLIDFLAVAGGRSSVEKFADDPLVNPVDDTGDLTIRALKYGLKIAKRITGNSPESLGLHPAVYFSNDKGKHSRFLFLGMCALVAEKLNNNDSAWFKKFTQSREGVEKFLLENKSVIGIVLQNLGKKTRVPRMKEMFKFLVDECQDGKAPEAQKVFSHLGLGGKIYDLTAIPRSPAFSDDTRSQIFYRQAISNAGRCPICRGLLDITKSVSYDHIVPVRDGGLGTVENGQLVHPYCNTGMKG